MNIHAGLGVAVREFPVVKPSGKRGSVDYVLYADAKDVFAAVGLIAGLAYNFLMVRTKSVGDCILAHAITK